jgi:alpha-galactosidase
MSHIGLDQDRLARFPSTGHWNDPDRLEIGNGGMSETEYRAHMSLWSMLAAPFIAGNDVLDMRTSIATILLNREVIAIDQDRADKQAKRVLQSGEQEVWTRELAVGDFAVALFNRAEEPTQMKVEWARPK